MGYDAYVNCNCYKSGLTSEPPYKEYLKIDEDGIYLDIEYLYKSNEELYWQMNEEFSLWRESACSHENMDLVNLGIANITGMAHFRCLLSNLGGEEKFPVLTEYLPVCNGGCIPVEYAKEALAEVEFIFNSISIEECLVLREKESKNIIASTNDPDSYYPFMWKGREKCQFGISSHGFSILQKVDADNSKVVFNSMNFIQEKQCIGIWNILRSKSTYVFKDLSNNQSYRCVSGIDENKSYPQLEFEVIMEKRPIVGKYSYILESLIKLLNASIETGNPVIWT